MNKIWLITKREFLSRVKKRSFVIMTLLGPVLIALFYGLIFYFVLNPGLGSEYKTIGIINYNDSIFAKIPSDERISYVMLNPYSPGDTVLRDGIDAILFIPKADSALNLSPPELKYKTKPGLGVKTTIERHLGDILMDARLQKNGLVTRSEFEKYKLKVNIRLRSEMGSEDDDDQEVAAGIGFAGAILIYIFIFMYGIQIMRGVIEEKSNRIVEVIISSVRPFQLMMGKILGIALVGLTQFSVWLIFGIATMAFGSRYINESQIQKIASSRNQISITPLSPQVQQPDGMEYIEAATKINFPLVLGCFLFFFLSGYLFYGAFFAAIGSAVDSETDTQQFMLPVTIPLIFAFFIASTSILNDYNSNLATWLSMIPFTAPVVTMVRIPFINEMNWEIALSMICMIISFVFTVWLAGRIYRTGILMYGKKISYKELMKWIKYK